MISLLTQECVLVFFFLFLVFSSHLCLKPLKTKNLKPKKTKFSFNYYEGNVKNDALLFFFCQDLTQKLHENVKL